MQTDYLKDSFLYMAIGITLSMLVKNKPLGAIKIIQTGKWFCYSMAIYLLYVFLPCETKQYILYFAYPFYMFWAGVGICSAIFAIIYYKKETLV